MPQEQRMMYNQLSEQASSSKHKLEESNTALAVSTSASSAERNSLNTRIAKLQKQLAKQQSKCGQALKETNDVKTRARATTQSLIETLSLFGDFSLQLALFADLDGQLAGQIQTFRNQLNWTLKSAMPDVGAIHTSPRDCSSPRTFYSLSSQLELTDDSLYLAAPVQAQLLEQAADLVQAVVQSFSEYRRTGAEPRDIVTKDCSDLVLEAEVVTKDCRDSVSEDKEEDGQIWTAGKMLAQQRQAAYHRNQIDIARQNALDAATHNEALNGYQLSPRGVLSPVATEARRPCTDQTFASPSGFGGARSEGWKSPQAN